MMCTPRPPIRTASNMDKKKWLFLLRLAISLTLIAYFTVSLSRQQGGLGPALQRVASAFGSASPAWLVPAFLLHLVGFTLISLRWKIMLRVQGIDSPFGRLFHFYLMAAFFNTFLPSTIGGDTVRAIESRHLTGRTSTSFLVVIVERLTGLAALVIISTVALVVLTLTSNQGTPAMWWIVTPLWIGAAVLILLAHPGVAPRLSTALAARLPPRWRQPLIDGQATLARYYHRPALSLAALGISVVFQLNMVVYYFLIAGALGRSPDFLDLLLKIPILIFLLMTVPAVNGLGVRTAGFKGLMKWPAAFALSGEAIDLGMRLVYGLIGGILFLAHRRPVRRGSVNRE